LVAGSQAWKTLRGEEGWISMASIGLGCARIRSQTLERTDCCIAQSLVKDLGP
jgi:hypothetical protein